MNATRRAAVVLFLLAFIAAASVLAYGLVSLALLAFAPDESIEFGLITTGLGIVLVALVAAIAYVIARR